MSFKLLLIGLSAMSLSIAGNMFLYYRYKTLKNNYNQCITINKELNAQVERLVNENNLLRRELSVSIEEYQKRLNVLNRKILEVNKIKQRYMEIKPDINLDDCANMKQMLDQLLEVENKK